MKYQPLIVILAMLAVGHVLPLAAQQDQIKLEAAKPKITTVSAMRVRKSPQIAAEEMMRLKLGTVVNVIARTANQESVLGKNDYWYLITLPNGATGWVFGGLLLDYDAGRRHELVREIIETRLKAENTDFADRQEIYNLAASSINEARDVNTRAEFELLKLLALASWARSFPDQLQDRSPYREWRTTHAAAVIPNEFGGSYNLRSELLWNLEKKYHSLPIADRIAWEAAQNPQPSDCEGDEVCHLFVGAGAIEYLGLHPNGGHAVEAIKYLTEALTDDVIRRANDKGGDRYAVEQRTDLRKLLASLRLAVAKTSAPEKAELLKKLERIR
jgi:hypothetical protein